MIAVSVDARMLAKATTMRNKGINNDSTITRRTGKWDPEGERQCASAIMDK
jgi:hypothetical protein